jgi:hypothetical protein
MYWLKTKLYLRFKLIFNEWEYSWIYKKQWQYDWIKQKIYFNFFIKIIEKTFY